MPATVDNSPAPYLFCRGAVYSLPYSGVGKRRPAAFRMNELKPKIHDETSGNDYVLAGDYYIPAIELPEGDDCLVGKWGRMHRAYPEETNPLLLNYLILTGRLHTYLADLNEQARGRYRHLIHQMAEDEGVTEDMKRKAQ